MNEPITNTLTVAFEDEAGRRFSESATATIEVVDNLETMDHVDNGEPEAGPYFENMASSHK